jgi:hypothetical protein
MSTDLFQLGQPVASAGAAEENRGLVADGLAAAAREDWWTPDQARQVLLGVARRGTSSSAAVWPDAAADLGSAGAERVALRLRLQNLEPGGGSVQCLRNRLRGNNWGASGGQKNEPSVPSSLDGACSGDKFVVSKAGQMYDAPASEPNRKSRLGHPYGYVLVF